MMGEGPSNRAEICWRNTWITLILGEFIFLFLTFHLVFYLFRQTPALKLSIFFRLKNFKNWRIYSKSNEKTEKTVYFSREKRGVCVVMWWNQRYWFPPVLLDEKISVLHAALQCNAFEDTVDQVLVTVCWYFRLQIIFHPLFLHSLSLLWNGRKDNTDSRFGELKFYIKGLSYLQRHRLSLYNGAV